MNALEPEMMVARSGTSVFMFTAPNPGPKTLEGTHTYVVGRRPACLIDPGPDVPEYCEALLDWLRREDIRVRAILLTHQHPDHAPGARCLQEALHVPIWASQHYEETQFEPVEPDFTYGPGQEFPVDEEAVRVVDAPGHSPDHVVFWLEEGGVLFSGDTILGRGSTLIAPPEGDMKKYMQSLRMMRSLEPYLVAPGHGPLITEPLAKIDEYVRHREDRERQVMEALRSGPLSVDEIVGRTYLDVDPQLRELAAGSVEAQMRKLVEEHRVEQVGERYRVM